MKKRMIAVGHIAPRSEGVEKIRTWLRVKWWLRDRLRTQHTNRICATRGHSWLLVGVRTVGTGCENYSEHYIAKHRCMWCAASRWTGVVVFGEELYPMHPEEAR